MPEKRIQVAVVQEIEPGGEYTDEGYGIIRLKLPQGTVPLALSASQIAQLVPQLSGLLGKLNRDSGVVWRAKTPRVARTLDDSLRFDFVLENGSVLSLATPMPDAAQVADRIREQAEAVSGPPPEGSRH